MITGLAAALLAVAAGTRLYRWWYRRSLTLAGTFLALACMSLHMLLNVQSFEAIVRDAFGVRMPSALKVMVVCGICVGTAIAFTDVTSKGGQRATLIRIHIALSLLTAALSFAFFFSTPWPSNVDNRTFDNEYAHLPGHAEGLMLGMAYPFLLCLMVAIVSIAQADRKTVTGRALFLVFPGAAILTVYAALRIGYLAAARYGLIEPTPTPFAISRLFALTGVLFLTAGLAVSLTLNWLAARSDHRRFSALWEELMERWPGALRDSNRGSSTADRVDDRAAELLDALSLEVEHSDLPAGIPLPSEMASAAIADWLITSRVADGLGYHSFFLDTEKTPTAWASELGNAYRTALESERKTVK